MTATTHFPASPGGPRSVAVAFEPRNVSVVVPVKDNQEGLDRLLSSFARLDPARAPGELVIVDNDSSPTLRVAPAPNVSVIKCEAPGPAAARNAGAREARGKWLLFIDSDCVATRTTVEGFTAAIDGSVGYAGTVRSSGRGKWAHFYDSQKTLVPPPSGIRPAYLVTANALILRSAFEAAGGFDERFRLAGGEDIELAIRLQRIGTLSYAPRSLVQHDFNDGVLGFARRFARYGVGNRLIHDLHGLDMKPRFFWPAAPTPFNVAASLAQVLAMRWGYERARFS